MLEIEAVGTIDFVHIFTKHQGEYARQHGIEPAYQVRLTFPKNCKTHRALVDEAKNLGVTPNTVNLRYTDAGDDWQLNLSSRYPITVADYDGNPIDYQDTEPGNGTRANVAFRIGCTRDKTRLVYFLTGVQLLDVVENDTAPHVFEPFGEDDEF